MAALVWFTTGVALWHFTVFLPTASGRGIVGALLGAVARRRGHRRDRPDRARRGLGETGIETVLFAIPGTRSAAVIWAIGVRRGRAARRAGLSGSRSGGDRVVRSTAPRAGSGAPRSRLGALPSARSRSLCAGAGGVDLEPQPDRPERGRGVRVAPRSAQVDVALRDDLDPPGLDAGRRGDHLAGVWRRPRCAPSSRSLEQAPCPATPTRCAPAPPDQAADVVEQATLGARCRAAEVDPRVAPAARGSARRALAIA